MDCIMEYITITIDVTVTEMMIQKYGSISVPNLKTQQYESFCVYNGLHKIIYNSIIFVNEWKYRYITSYCSKFNLSLNLYHMFG